MYRPERFIRLKNIHDHVIFALLHTSGRTQRAEGMDMGQARWYFQRKRPALVLEMDVTRQIQGWFEINHGGSTDKILHSVAGFAGVMQARRLGKMALGKHFESHYDRPVPLYTAVTVTARVERVEDKEIFCSAVIENAYETKVLARGSLTLHMVDQIRRKRV